MILLSIITIGCSVCCFMALYCFCKNCYKKIESNFKELKDVPRVETLQVFVSKPRDYFNGTVSINTLNSFNKEKVADYFIRKLIEDNLIKIEDRGDFYEANLTIIKE